MLENRLIEHCSPTLAGIKCANLFNYHYEVRQQVEQELEEINGKLNSRGVYVEALLWKEDYTLIYTYRKSHLARRLAETGVMDLLMQYDYKNCEVEACLKHLQKRLFQYDCFPHEIGVFLGYPLEDVIGFIEHKGRDCKCCGLWKVYCDEVESVKMFQKIQRCTQIYLQVFAEGRTISQMTVVA